MHILKILGGRGWMRAFGIGMLSLWTAFRASGSVVINEIHYHPDVNTEPAKFVELYNAGTNTVDLSGWYFSAGIGFVFPAGASLAPDGYLVVAQNPAFLRTKYGATALGPFTGNLSGNGEKLTLRNAEGKVEDEVSYQLGFPWPTVGDAPGYSIELINPSLDNNLAGSWRASVRTGAVTPVEPPILLIPQGSEWHYRKGTGEASTPSEAWRFLDFDDSDWAVGNMPIGYDGTETMGTRLDDMRNNYTSFYARRTFIVEDIAAIGKVMADVKYDDGFNMWINGHHVMRQSLDSDEMPYNGTSNTTRESGSYDTFELASARSYLVAGTNEIAVQVHNLSLGISSDAFIDLKLYADPKTSFANRGPTPGSGNSVFATNAPPQIRQVDHAPQTPASGVEVKITAKITDPDGVALVTFHYQVVEPGNYIELGDAAFQTQWTSIPMKDDGTEGDAMAADDVYTALLPASIQVNRRLIRYRITASDSLGVSVSVPYADDPQPNFAYFVYDGVPAWQGAVRPGVTPVIELGTNAMRSLPVYHLISKQDTVERSTWRDQYQGNYYNYAGAIVYEGKVYDHIRFRARGGVWRYAMGKNMWKFDMNRGHDFEPRDNFGKRYDVNWRKLNLGSCIQQGDYGHRGEQGMFESVGFKLFNMAGVEGPNTHFVQFRVIDKPDEVDPANQYAGDFWGLYLAVEQEDGRFLDEHNLPDGNFYKMEGGSGTLNNQGATAVTDRSDLNRFMNTYRGNPTESWWRTNLDLSRYYKYRTIVEAIHHYDIDEGAGKNYNYYLNPETGLWSVHPWDLDLTWANNMYGGGNEPFKNRVLPQATLNLEYRNSIREIRDLLFNTEQTGLLIDEFAAMIHDPNGGPSFTDADRAQWDYNPVMVSAYVNSGKAGQGLYYRWPNEPNVSKDFDGAVTLMKNYVGTRSAFLDALATDPLIPRTPTITTAGSPNFAFNKLVFKTSAYSGNGGGFAALRWRLAEVTPDGMPPFDPNQPRKYEIASVWESGELTQFNDTITIPSQSVKIGRTYRVRASMKDSSGRWSHWSDPVQFVAGEPEGGQALAENLKITELMYNPTVSQDFEYIELFNASESVTLELGGAKFSNGIDFTFSPGVAIAPRRFLLLAKGDPTNSFSACRSHYGIPDSVSITGPFTGNLDNKGETLTLLTGPGGTTIFSFAYGNNADWPVIESGKSLTLLSATASANEPQNWIAANPSPGYVTNRIVMRLETPLLKSDGTINIQAAYAGADALEVEFSTNLVNWSPWANTNAHDGLFEFSVTNRLNSEPQFFRLKK